MIKEVNVGGASFPFVFLTKTDTEVLVHAVQEPGVRVELERR